MPRRSRNGMAERFRARLKEPGFIELPGCYDVLSAMLIQRAGFEQVFLSGYGAAASLLGVPDIGLTTLTETTMLARNIVDAVQIPVVVDIDDGYGGEESVARTVRELEALGVAAVILEDQVSPKRCGHSATKEVLPVPVYMKKLERALRTRETELVIVARTDAMDLDEAIGRAKTFHEAGADVTLIDGLRSAEAMKRVANEVPGPKQINFIWGGKTAPLSCPELYTLGFKVILYSTPALYLAVHALERGLATLSQTHDLRSIAEASSTFSQVQELLNGEYTRRQGETKTGT